MPHAQSEGEVLTGQQIDQEIARFRLEWAHLRVSAGNGDLSDETTVTVAEHQVSAVPFELAG